MKIYTEKRFLPLGRRHLELFNPIWGANYSSNDDQIISGNLQENFNRLPSIELSYTDNINESDIAILPGDWKQYLRSGNIELAIDFANLASKSGKKMAIFYHDDSEEKIPISDAYIFRTSLNSKKRSTREFALPAWHSDYLQKSEIILRGWNQKPTVGFCGNSRITHFQSLKWDVKHTLSINDPGYNFLKLRKNIINLLNKSKNDISTNFILREGYFGGFFKEKGTGKDDLLKIKEEYVNNLINSDYILCVRGKGNFSFRFYETLCCGRLPLLINTDCVFPFEDQIDYKAFCVFVEKGEYKKTANKLIKFHKQLSYEEFNLRQKYCREIWEKYLSPQGFFSHFRSFFESPSV